MDIFYQLGDLCVQALPTIVIVLLFTVFLRWAFFGPIEGVFEQRKARIEGARAEAAAAQAEAHGEIESYNEALKRARATIFADQEAIRQKALDDRARLLKAMRTRSQETIDEARHRIEMELERARTQVEQNAGDLANDVARSILEKPATIVGGVR